MRLSLYIHVPFCSSKCSYCDFYSLPAGNSAPSVKLKKRYVVAVLKETALRLAAFKDPVIETVYIGGGTPSSLGADIFSDLLTGINRLISGLTVPGFEFTTEANIGSCSADFLSAAESAGINRLSLGVQSFDRQVLRYLGRQTGSFDIMERVKEISDSWKKELSLDIISGTGADPLTDLELAVKADPDHLSVYQLIVEEGTPLAASINRGTRKAPDEGLQSDAIKESIIYLKSKGYERYEISNFSKPGRQSRHNLAYWNMQSYLGAGPSAVSSIYEPGPRIRIENCRDVETYLNAVETERFEDCRTTETISDADFLIEHFIMGYRLTSGINEEVFRSRFGAESAEFIPETAERWLSNGMLNPDLHSLNTRGLLFLDSFLYEVFDEISEKNKKN